MWVKHWAYIRYLLLQFLVLFFETHSTESIASPSTGFWLRRILMGAVFLPLLESRFPFWFPGGQCSEGQMKGKTVFTLYGAWQM